MNNHSIQTSAKKGIIKPIILTALVAGTLDAIGAIVVYQANAFRLFQYIASGAIGHDAAFSGEWGTALLGVILHYLIATCWTFFFFLAFPWIQKSHINKYILGILYGAVVWIGMNLIVLPISTIGMGTFTPKGVLIGIAILMLMIGLPISFLAHRFLAHDSKQRHS